MLDNPIRPLTFSPAAPARVAKGRTVRALLYGDTHFPYQDSGALKVVAKIAKDEQPAVLCHMGDLLDCYSLSRFDKNPDRKDSMQDEINQARMHLAQMRDLCPDARFIYLEGNHEDRLRRVLWNLEGPSAVLSQLTAFKQAITWPTLLGLDKLHIEFVPYGTQHRRGFLPKFMLKHGNLVRQKSAYTAHGEWARHGMSGASGHTHRLGAFYRRDMQGSHVWLEAGCTCLIDPEYVAFPDWQQGCVIAHFDTKTGAVQPEPISIQEGTAMYRGQFIGTK